ncbi:MAG: hypothetical protein NUV84_03900, partial [Candidatus Uhrbacteria bacterium]|nr:hypothetical protein [Candidatus Uhrbacteria bacterium]
EKKPKEPVRGNDRKKPKPHSDIAPTKDKPSDEEPKSKADTAQSVPPPDLVHGFQASEDGGRLLRELIREFVAAEKPERKATRQRRLDAEEQERQRRLTADTAERLRRQEEEQEALRKRLEIEADDLRRRLEIEAKANEEKRLADLRVAAEKQRLADEADARKRDADEANRLARKAQEEREAAEKTAASRPKPLIDVTDRTIPALTREILAYEPYRTWRVWMIEAFRLIRTGSPDEKAHKRVELPHMRRLIDSMKASDDRMEFQSGFHLDRLLRVLEDGRDLSDPASFQANYVTGTYTD